MVLWGFGGLLLFGIASAIVGSNKGRSGFGWFLCGLFFGPFGLILSLVVAKKAQIIERQAVQSGVLQKCPFCAELIKSEAIKCRFCQADLSVAIAAEKERCEQERMSKERAKIQIETESRLIGLIQKTYVKRDWSACRDHTTALLKECPESEYRHFCNERLKEIERYF